MSGVTTLINGSRVTVSAPGYVTRETSATAPRVDLFPRNGFALDFYRQLTRGAMQPGRTDPLWVLPASPAFYMEVDGAKGLSGETAARLEAVARRIVPLITGGRMHVTRWETGPTPRQPQRGWITIERRDDRTDCGWALIGDLAGSIWLNGNQRCRTEAIFAHELGHAFGFFHVDRVGSMMYPYELATGPAADAPTELERHHMALMYARPRGNRDVDIDP